MWDYTPRQAARWEELALRQINLDRAMALRIACLGSRGKPDAIKDQMREWQA